MSDIPRVNSDSAAAAAAVAKRDASRTAGETDAGGQTDKTDNVIALLRIGTIIKRRRQCRIKLGAIDAAALGPFVK